MSWRLRSKLSKAPAGVGLVSEKLEQFESKMREATAAPRGTAMNHELTWPVHKLHFEKNRFIYEMRYVREEISDSLLKYLVKEKIADGALIAKWRKPGYDTLCSLSVITRSNTNFGTVGICRTPLKDRQGQIMPNVQTGCVCCVSGSGGPIWWNDPVPEIVRERILDIDPGKADLFEEGTGLADEGGDGRASDDDGNDVVCSPTTAGAIATAGGQDQSSCFRESLSAEAAVENVGERAGDTGGNCDGAGEHVAEVGTRSLGNEAVERAKNGDVECIGIGNCAERSSKPLEKEDVSVGKESRERNSKEGGGDYPSTGTEAGKQDSGEGSVDISEVQTNDVDTTDKVDAAVRGKSENGLPAESSVGNASNAVDGRGNSGVRVEDDSREDVSPRPSKKSRKV